ncbi:2789_t:CDS:2, partial [Rhizophagus irregularis]
MQNFELAPLDANFIIQVSRCLGIWDLGFGVKIIGFPTSWQ